ncbi:hypothetical protein [Nocardia sp. NPDC051832]|uniref:hypothetical protein n=1 Tax=Nocardia sp. NPDC051832 TaxID=3155673 RepID=UPI003429F0DC
MGRFVWTLLAGFAVGTPAIPLGLSLSLPVPATLAAVLLGAAGCVVFAVFAMEHAVRYWQSWRARRKPVLAQADSVGVHADAQFGGAAKRGARRVFDRFGAAGFGIVGPALLGTWGSALLGGALGIPRWRLIGWLMAGITLWCVVLLVVSDAAIAIFSGG